MEHFDCHLHVEDGLENYDLPLANANVIFNSTESYEKHASKYNNYYHSIIFDLDKELDYYKELLSKKRIRALKIHSRIQKIGQGDYPLLISKLEQLESNVPIIYDAFYYGSELAHQPSLLGLITMLKAFPKRKFIVAHAGGYEVLKYFFHLRNFENIGYDLSLSLQYLYDSSCSIDFIKLIQHTPSERLFFGSDYPFASPIKQAGILKKMIIDSGLKPSDEQGIFQTNWIDFTAC